MLVLCPVLIFREFDGSKTYSNCGYIHRVVISIAFLDIICPNMYKPCT